MLLCYRSIGTAFAFGAGVTLSANGFLTWRVYQKHKSLQAEKMLFGFLGGEVGKYCIIVVLTALLAKYAKLDWIFYVLGLALPQLLGLLGYLLKTRIKN